MSVLPGSGYNRLIKYYYKFIYNNMDWTGLDCGRRVTKERKKEKSQKSVGENDELINKQF